MISFDDWITEERYSKFVHKFRKGDTGKYSRKLAVTKDEVLSVVSFDIPKETVLTDKNGKERIVYTLPHLQTMFCSLYAEYLSEVYRSEVHDNVVSYRKGTSVGKVCSELSKTVKGRTFIKLDITKYFDSVSKCQIRALLGKLNLPKELVLLYTGKQVVTKEGEVEDRFLGLIQGNPLSSFLANALLYEFDKYMCENHEVYFRYSDDIIFSKNTDTDISAVEELLFGYGLTINEKKTYYYTNKVEFLGLIVEQGRVTASEKYVAEFRKQVKLTTHEKKQRDVNKYLSRVIQTLAGSWLHTTMYGCRLEYLFNSLTSSHQFFELDNAIYTNIQYLLTGSRNSNVACKRGFTLKTIMDNYGFSLERAFSLYKESEILARAYLIYFTKPTDVSEVDIPLSDVLSSTFKEFESLTETLSYIKDEQLTNISWNRVYDDSGFLSEPSVLEPYVKNLAVLKPKSTSISLGKMSRLERHHRFDLDYDYKLFLTSVATNSVQPENGFSVLRDADGSCVAARYQGTSN